MEKKKLSPKSLSKLFFILTFSYLALAAVIHFTAPLAAPEEQEVIRVMFYGSLIMSPVCALMGLRCWLKAKRLEKKDEEVINYKPIS